MPNARGAVWQMGTVRCRRARPVKAIIKYALVGLVAIVAVLAIWPYRLIASPNSKIRVVDDSGRPLTGVRVVREWRTSEEHHGQDEAATDASGVVSFQQMAVHMSLLKRITKPLLVFVPASCGPGWEVYGHSEFRIYWPTGYALRLDGGKWKREYEVWKSADGVCIRDPAVIQQYRHESYVELYFFNKRQDFEYTLTFTEIRNDDT
jgi:hypothetical protein